MINLKRWFVEIVILSLVFAGVGYAAHEQYFPNGIKFSGAIIADDAAGPTIVDETATSTNPTLIPNKAETDTGIGWASDTLHIVLGGADEYSFSISEAIFKAILTVKPDGTNEVLQVNDGSVDFTDGNAGTAGTMTIDSDGDISYNKDFAATDLDGILGSNTPAAIAGTTIAGTGVMTVSPDATNEVFQVNDGSIDFTDGNAGTTGTLTIDSSGNLSYNKSLLVTTGTLHGKIEIIADDNSLSAAQCYGSVNKLNGAKTTTLPAAVAGMSVLPYSDDATKKTIDPNGTDHIWLNGVDLGAGVSIDSPATVGDFIVLIAFSNNNWYSLGQSGTWVVTP